MDFIDEKRIEEALDSNKYPDRQRIESIIAKARQLNGLDFPEVAALLNTEDSDLVRMMAECAKEIKEEIYGNRIVLFAPLYTTNACVNNCLYCAFRHDNKDLERKTLDIEMVEEETAALLKQGHKRLLLVGGENPRNLQKTIDLIKAVYSVNISGSNIRRVNVNIAPLSVEQFKELKEAGIGTYQLFQETYHYETYRKMHPNGPKANYSWRLLAMDRAMEAGIDDVGIGVLYGLYDHKFETLALLQHIRHLEENFGCGPHTISVPRIKPAFNTPLSGNIPCPVSDDEFKKLVSIIRMAVPYTGMILSTREPTELRNEILKLGISQMSAGSKTNPGAYKEHDHIEEEKGKEKGTQFYVSDERTHLQVVKDLMRDGFFPSYCTACYRRGRTGKDFMDLAKPGDIKKFCVPNCILTLEEYLQDYGDEEAKNKGNALIRKEMEGITDDKMKRKTEERLMEIKGGKRDLYF